MKKIVLFSSCLILFSNCIGQNRIINREYLDISNDKALTGEISLDILNAEDFSDWYTYEYESYTPDKLTLKKLRKYISSYKICIFMGTWDQNSQQEIPRLLKTLKEVRHPHYRLEIIGLTRKLESFYGEQMAKNIENIPTVIIYRKNREKGRIKIHPKNSWEEDLLKIVEKR